MEFFFQDYLFKFDKIVLILFYMKILRYQSAGIQTIALEMEMKAFFFILFFRFSDNFLYATLTQCTSKV